MHHYMDIHPDQIRERNKQILSEVNWLRLRDRLRKNREPRGSTSVTFRRVVEAPSR
jgi:hypothetical protein